mmetsp:Transcript_90756/g.259641  ORF Transcript_90756/g.259641 Transcript_90756/m.259641 type:complete len:217 (+) Transcript_90756:153-803(+)
MLDPRPRSATISDTAWSKPPALRPLPCNDVGTAPSSAASAMPEAKEGRPPPPTKSEPWRLGLGTPALASRQVENRALATFTPSMTQKTVTALPHLCPSAWTACTMPYTQVASKQACSSRKPSVGKQPCRKAPAIFLAASSFWRSASSVRPSLSYFSASTPWLMASTRPLAARKKQTIRTPRTPSKLPMRRNVVPSPGLHVKGTCVEYHTSTEAIEE